MEKEKVVTKSYCSINRFCLLSTSRHRRFRQNLEGPPATLAVHRQLHSLNQRTSVRPAMSSGRVGKLLSVRPECRPIAEQPDAHTTGRRRDLRGVMESCCGNRFREVNVNGIRLRQPTTVSPKSCFQHEGLAVDCEKRGSELLGLCSASS